MDYFECVRDAVEHVALCGDTDDEIIAIPPDVSENTDEDDISINESIGVEMVQDIAGTVAVIGNSSDDDNDKSKKPLKWEKTPPDYAINKNTKEFMVNISELSKLKGKTPLEYFEEFFSPDIVELIVQEMNRYGKTDEDNPGYSVTLEKVKKFIGFLLFNTFIRTPDPFDDGPFGIPIVQKNYSQEEYSEMRDHLHFIDNSLAKDQKDDKTFKVKNLIAGLNKNFQKWGLFHKYLTIGDMLVPYEAFGTWRNKSKQIRFGYKLRTLCGNGYCYKFSLFCGEKKLSSLEQRKQIIDDLLSPVENPSSHVLYLDRSYNSVMLLIYLKEKGFRSSGFISSRETEGAAVLLKQNMKKSNENFDYLFNKEHEVTVIRQNCKFYYKKYFSDAATNFDSIDMVAPEERKNYRPKVINNLTKHVQKNHAVDEYFRNIYENRIMLLSKKWYWNLFTWMLNMALENAHYLYCKVEGVSMDRGSFSKEIFTPYLGHTPGEKYESEEDFSDIPESSYSDEETDSSFDEEESCKKTKLGDHKSENAAEEQDCKYPGCGGTTFQYCAKCHVHLCPPCFPWYHSKE